MKHDPPLTCLADWEYTGRSGVVRDIHRICERLDLKTMKILIGGTPTGTLKHITEDVYRKHCGMLTSWRDGAHPRSAVALGAIWGMDNYSFRVEKFDPQAFVRALVRWQDVPNCKFAAVPDVPRDAKATLARFWRWHDIVRSYGYPVALVIQNWITTKDVPWQNIDAIFVGGDDPYKFSPDAQAIIDEANARGLWTHNGRINSSRRWTYALHQGVKSVDGSGLVSDRRRIKEALAVLRDHDQYLFAEGV